MGMILHIAKRLDWEASVAAGYYRPASLESDGFIHCSMVDQAVDTANQFFRNQPGLVLLGIDPDKLEAELKYEPPAVGPVQDPRVQAQFPHLYGPLNVSAVVRVLDFVPGADGRFTLPAVIHQLIED